MTGHRPMVAVRAADPARDAWLRETLEAAGWAVADDASLVLADLADGGAAPHEVRPLVAMSADPAALAGADVEGVLARDASPAQIDAALRAVMAGLTVRAPVADRAFGATPPPMPNLTPRELQILEALGEGMSNKEVARALGISAHTVKFHLEAVFQKLHARSRADAVARGLRFGLIEV